MDGLSTDVGGLLPAHAGVCAIDHTGSLDAICLLCDLGPVGPVGVSMDCGNCDFSLSGETAIKENRRNAAAIFFYRI